MLWTLSFRQPLEENRGTDWLEAWCEMKTTVPANVRTIFATACSSEPTKREVTILFWSIFLEDDMKGESFEITLIDGENRFNSLFNITAFSEMCYLSKQSAFHRFHCKTRQLEEIRPPFWFNVARPYVQLCTCHVNNTRCPKKSAKCHLNVSLFPILHLFISFPFLSDLVSITIFHKIMLTSESSLVKYDVMKISLSLPENHSVTYVSFFGPPDVLPKTHTNGVCAIFCQFLGLR